MPRFCGNLEIGAEKCTHRCGSVQSRGSVMGGFARWGFGLRGNCRGGGTRCRQRRQGAKLPERRGRPEGARCRQGAKLGNSAGVAAYFGGIGGLVSCRSCFVNLRAGKTQCSGIKLGNLGVLGISGMPRTAVLAMRFLGYGEEFGEAIEGVSTTVGRGLYSSVKFEIPWL